MRVPARRGHKISFPPRPLVIDFFSTACYIVYVSGPDNGFSGGLKNALREKIAEYFLTGRQITSVQEA